MKVKEKELKKQGQGNKPNATTALSQEREFIFSLKKKGLGNKLSTITTEHCVVAQPVGAMLFWRLTVKAKSILFIQRDKLTVDRATTHEMLGV